MLTAALLGAGCAPDEEDWTTKVARTGAAAETAGDAPCSTVPLRPDGHLALVPVSIGVHDSLLFVLDTAASTSMISPHIRDRIGFDKTDGMRASFPGTSEQNPHQVLRLDSLQVGAYTARSVSVAVVDQERFQRSDVRYAGVLGNDVLQHFDFEYDMPDRRLRLCRPGEGGATPIAELDTLTRVPFKNKTSTDAFVRIDLTVGDRPATGVLDTGAGVSVFNWNAARQDGATKNQAKRHEGGTRGVGAKEATETHLYTFEDLRAGGVRFRPTEVRIADLPFFQLLHLDKQAAVIMGGDVVNDRVLVVAYSTRDVYLSGSLTQD